MPSADEGKLHKLVFLASARRWVGIEGLDTRCTRTSRAFKEGRDQGGHLFRMRFQREMSCIQQMNLRIWQITLIGSRTSRNKGGIMASPHSQKRRLVFAEVRLKVRVACDVCAVIEDQIELYLLGSREGHIGDVQFISVGRQ